MKRKASEDFNDGEEHQTKVRRLLQHHPGTIETPEWHQQFQTLAPREADVDLRNVIDNFVQLYERLDNMDDINIKPNYSYTELVYLAILRSPNFCLPITEIYRYIQHRFMFFRHSTRQHWKNAIRHSLSKTKCFSKINVDRRDGQSGRSNFLWTIVPSSIVSFARGDYRTNVDKESGANTLRVGYFKVNAGQFWDRVACVVLQKLDSFKQLVGSYDCVKNIVRAQVCTLPSTTPPEGKGDSNRTPSPGFRKEQQCMSSSVQLQRPDSFSPVMPNSFDFTKFPSCDSPLVNYTSPTSGYPYGIMSDSGNQLINHSSPISGYPYVSVNESRDSGNASMTESSPENSSFSNCSVHRLSSSMDSSYSSNQSRGNSPVSTSVPNILDLSPTSNHSMQNNTSATNYTTSQFHCNSSNPNSAYSPGVTSPKFHSYYYQDYATHYPCYSNMYPTYSQSGSFSSSLPTNYYA